MDSYKKQRKQLINWAIISSPLIGLYNIIPMMMLIALLSEFDPAILELKQEGYIFIFPIIFISTSIFILWFINIYLLRRWQLNKGIFGFKQQRARYLFSSLFALCLVSIIHILIRPQRPEAIPDLGFFVLYPLFAALFHNSIILLLIGLNESQRQRSNLMLEKSQLKIAQLNTEQEQLKQQIHPHFLFNALSTLKIFIKNDAEKANEYVHNLSDYLRQSIDLGRKNLIPIKEDIAFLDNYISLQKVRFGNNLQLDVDLNLDDLENYEVPIFTFQILAENAIKHNAFNSTKPLIVTLHLNDENEIVVSNNRLPKVTLVESTGFGLENLSQRFRLYAAKNLFVEQTDGAFIVTLPIIYQ